MEQQQIRFLVLSDTHDNAFPEPTLPEVDVVIHCGDLTMIGGLSNYRRALESLAACPAELKLVIAGNHDVSLDAKWWQQNLDSDDEDEDEPARAHALFLSDEFKNRGIRLLEEGTHEIILRDGRKFTAYSSPYTPSFGGYAFGYSTEEDRFNTKGEPSRIPDDRNIDIVVTHGPPQPPHSLAAQSYQLDRNGEQQHLGCLWLWKAIERTRPKMHCFGHIHEGHGAQMVMFEDSANVTISDVKSVEKDGALHIRREEGTTLLVNAAIMRHGEESNKPWVVDITF
ncbi:Metallophosphoesterase domain-containing protein 1 [Paramyrothecium foliicola]|nr:Metallophosphoesterase domain-containing protein 1 [Paramyrothecium foliicola]